MNCITDVNIPSPLVEPCDNNYFSSDCILIPEANVTLDLPANSKQTEVNDAITLALIAKQQQIEELQGELSTVIVNGNNTVVSGTGVALDPFIIDLDFDINDYQLKNIPDDVTVASALNEGKLRYRTDANNSYVDMSMKTGNLTYSWVNIITTIFAT